MLSRLHIGLTVTSILLGFLLTISFLTKQRTQILSPRKSELVEVVNELQRDRDNLKKSLNSLRNEILNFERQSAAAKGRLAVFSQKENQLKDLNGLLPKTGDGIKIVLADAQNVPPGANPNDYIVHNTDLQAIANALFVGGAEAISVNGERLVGSSAIRCAGNTILVNSNLIGSPYEVLAVGNSEKMKKALRADITTRILIDEIVKKFGINFELREEKVTVSVYRGGLGINKAKLITGGK